MNKLLVIVSILVGCVQAERPAVHGFQVVEYGPYNEMPVDAAVDALFVELANGGYKHAREDLADFGLEVYMRTRSLEEQGECPIQGCGLHQIFVKPEDMCVANTELVHQIMFVLGKLYSWTPEMTVWIKTSDTNSLEFHARLAIYRESCR